MHPQPTVHILLATHNGARYLADQLQSITRQTHSAWTLTVSDDGSTDDTLAIVQRFSAHVDQPVTVLQGPRQGSSTANFCHLLSQAPTGFAKDLYAFCDQDDVWHDDKLERAVQFHAQHPSQIVRLYCGRTQFVNEQLHPIGLSPSIKRPPSFGNALVQNIASGNTMVFSQAVLSAQKKIQLSHSVWHDWTTYIVATALDGLVWFDNEPCLFYRQHAANVIGSNDGLKAQIARLKPLFGGRFKEWSNMNVCAVQEIEDLINKQNLQTFAEFIRMRSAPRFSERLSTFYKSEIRRQHFLSNATLVLALAFNLS
jgi:glycosyltransferase involved in cell wall biosynthesis